MGGTTNQGISQITAADNSDGVYLPCEPNQFGEFISKLLGKPQKLEKFVFGHFEISENDVLNFHHLVDQRIKEQNESKLISITFNILYDDDSSYTVRSLEEFQGRVELEKKRSVAIYIEWVYLVKFLEKGSSEKQVIEISIVTNEETATVSQVEEGVISFRKLPRLKQGYIHIRILHTAKTWGHDIESLLIKHAKKQMLRENTIAKFINNHSFELGFFTFVFLSITFIVYSFLSTRNLINNIHYKLNEISIHNTIQSVLTQKKLDFLIDNIANGVWHKHYNNNSLLLVVGITISFVLGIWVYSAANNRPKSYLLLTKESETHSQKNKNKYSTKWLSFIGAIIVSLATSVFGNYIYAFLTKIPD